MGPPAAGRREETELAQPSSTADAAADRGEEFPGTTPALRLAADEFKAKNLKDGMVAPDILGEDIDGVEFKLSDYRGKVVLLDFWGDW